MEDSLVVSKVKAAFPQALLATEDMSGAQALVIDPASLVEVVQLLQSDPELDFNFLMDLGGADYLKFPQPKPGRFCISYQFYSLSKNQRTCLKVYLPAENPSVATLSSLYAGANWFEREAFDMYGIQFPGHPDLRRLLMYAEFEGHPLRKDYAIGKMQPLIPMRDAIDYEQVRVQQRKNQAQGK